MMSDPIRILYVDDSPLDRDLVLNSLEKENIGFQVVEAASRAEFESHLVGGHFDLVLSDFNILGFEDLQVLDVIHAQDPNVPVILVTDVGSEEIAVEALKRGAADCVIKTPQNIQRLPLTIQAVLEKKKIQDENWQLAERYSSIYENAVEGIYQSTPGGQYLSVNPAMARIYGYDSPQEMVDRITGIGSQIYVNSEDRIEFIRLLTNYGRVENFEAPNYRKDGSIIWVRTDARLVQKAGRDPYFEGFLSDITAHKKADQALLDNESRLESIFNSVMDAILIIDDFQNIVIFNPAAEYMFRCKASDVIGRSLEQFLPIESRRRHADFVRRFGESGVTRRTMNSSSFPLNCLRANGEMFPGEISISQFEIAGQRFYTAIIRDVTEREQAQAKIRESEDRYRDLVEHIHELIGTHDLDGNILSINSAATELLGIEMDRLLTMNMREILVPEMSSLFDHYVKIIKRDKRASGLMYVQTRLGERRIWEYDNSLRTDSVDKPIVRALARDVTEQKQIEKALRESEARYRDIFDGVQEAIFVETLDGKILTANERACEMYGYSREDFLTKTVADLVPKDRPILWVGGEGRSLITVPVESVNLRANGEAFPIEISGRYQTINGERVVLVVVRDITERKHAEEKSRRQVEYLTALRDIDHAITSAFDMQMSLSVLVSRALAILHVDAITVLLLNPLMNILEFTAGAGFWTPTVKTYSITLDQSYAGKAVLERRIIAIPNLAEEPNNLFRSGFLSAENFISYHGIPLTVKGKAIGVLEVFSRSIIQRDEDWFGFLTNLAGQAAIAIENARLFEDLQISNTELNLAYEATIEGWSRALDLRDRETEGHTQRVTEQTLDLARQMGIPDFDLVHIRRGALLHDIGKMGVPDSILLKSDTLSEQETAIMRKHPIFAFELLSPIRYLKSAAIDIPYCHHECWDGSGYPRGLQGEQIPLSARIFAVIDVYDALTSDRPYRSGWPKDTVLEYIRSLSGKQFDPEVVRVFLHSIIEQ